MIINKRTAQMMLVLTVAFLWMWTSPAQAKRSQDGLQTPSKSGFVKLGMSDGSLSQERTSTKQDQAPKTQEVASLPVGLYRVPVNLWHNVEDKPSMGNGALDHDGILEVTDEGIHFYLGSKTMEVQSIVASLINLFVQGDDGDYTPAMPADFSISVAGEAEKRPAVFRLDLPALMRMIPVMVDPKVEPMGDEPIKARLKLDIDEAQPIKEAPLKEQFENGAKKPPFDPNADGFATNKGLKVSYKGGVFTSPFTFYGNKLAGKRAEQIRGLFDPLDVVNGFNIAFLGPLERIAADEKSPQATRQAIPAQKSFTVELPLLNFQASDPLEVYIIEGKKPRRVDASISGKSIVFEASEAGDFAVVKKAGGTPLPTAESRGKDFLAKTAKPQRKKTIAPARTASTQPKPSVPVPSSNVVPTPAPVAATGAALPEPSPSVGEGPSVDLQETAMKAEERTGVIVFGITLLLAMNIGSITMIRRYGKPLMEEWEEYRRLNEMRQQSR